MTKEDHAFVNIGALYIASSLRKAGHEVRFIDLVRYSLDENDIKKMVKDFRPDLIAFSGIITAYYQLEPLSNSLKREFGDIPQLVGGSVGPSAVNLIERYTGADFVCMGEGEEMAPALLREMAGGKRWEKVPNLMYRGGDGTFRKSEEQQMYIEDLDSVPYPAYDLVDMEFYIAYSTSVFSLDLGEKGRPSRITTMVVSRGCPFSCSFCYRLIKKWRHHSIDNIIAHFRMMKERYGITAIVLNDELIFVDRKWFISLCDAIAASGLGLRFACGGGKPGIVTEEMIAAMKKAGFKRIGYGIESGSPKILSLMKKEVTVEKNYQALYITHKHGIISRSNIVFGHPGEDAGTVKETMRFIESVQLLQEKFGVLDDELQIWFATAYPGSPIYEQARSRGLIPDERGYLLRVTSQAHCHLNLSDFRSMAQLKSAVDKGLTWLDVKRSLRRKRYARVFKKLQRMIYLHIIYALTLGRCATLNDAKRMLGLPETRPERFRETLRKRMGCRMEGFCK